MRQDLKIEFYVYWVNSQAPYVRATFGPHFNEEKRDLHRLQSETFRLPPFLRPSHGTHLDGTDCIWYRRDHKIVSVFKWLNIRVSSIKLLAFSNGSISGFRKRIVATTAIAVTSSTTLAFSIKRLHWRRCLYTLYNWCVVCRPDSFDGCVSAACDS
jgi:hypothetical protein